MAFWINERLGVAFETSEYGMHPWNPETKEFSKSLSIEEIRDLFSGDSKRVSESKAIAFALAHQPKDSKS